jgi:hypothetical protein
LVAKSFFFFPLALTPCWWGEKIEGEAIFGKGHKSSNGLPLLTNPKLANRLQDYQLINLPPDWRVFFSSFLGGAHAG